MLAVTLRYGPPRFFFVSTRLCICGRSLIAKELRTLGCLHFSAGFPSLRRIAVSPKLFTSGVCNVLFWHGKNWIYFLALGVGLHNSRRFFVHAELRSVWVFSLSVGFPAFRIVLVNEVLLTLGLCGVLVGHGANRIRVLTVGVGLRSYGLLTVPA
jgi:hypothetical protein